jgi:hypothetical protein
MHEQPDLSRKPERDYPCRLSPMEDHEFRSQALIHIRKESLDLYNRVQSIAEDCEFVHAVHQVYPNLPVVRE